MYRFVLLSATFVPTSLFIGKGEKPLSEIFFVFFSKNQLKMVFNIQLNIKFLPEISDKTNPFEFFKTF